MVWYGLGPAVGRSALVALYAGVCAAGPGAADADEGGGAMEVLKALYWFWVH